MKPQQIRRKTYWKCLPPGLLYGLFLILLSFFSCPCSAEIPEIKVLVARYPKTFFFQMDKGGTWQCGKKSGSIKHGKKLSITGQINEPAKIEYHVIVESLPMREPEKLDQAISKWTDRGLKLRQIHVGSKSMGKDGKTLLFDGRVVFLGVGCYGNKEDAQAHIDRLAAKGFSSWTFQEVVKLPQGTLSLCLGKKHLATGSTTVAEWASGTCWSDKQA